MAKYTDEIKLSVERAATNLQAAREALAKGEYDTAAARAAESAYHAASALLLNDEIETSQHGDVIALIHQNFVNRRRLTKEQGEKLSWILQLGKDRKAGAAVPLIAGEAQKAVEFAESFLAATKVILES